MYDVLMVTVIWCTVCARWHSQ